MGMNIDDEMNEKIRKQLRYEKRELYYSHNFTNISRNKWIDGLLTYKTGRILVGLIFVLNLLDMWSTRLIIQKMGWSEELNPLFRNLFKYGLYTEAVVFKIVIALLVSLLLLINLEILQMRGQDAKFAISAIYVLFILLLSVVIINFSNAI